MFEEMLLTGSRIGLNFKYHGKSLRIVGRHCFIKSLVLVFIAIIQSGCDAINKDYHGKLSIEHQSIISLYYSPREINRCGIEIDQIRYIENLSGTVGVEYSSMHDGGVLIVRRDPSHLNNLASEIPIVSSGKLGEFLKVYKNFSIKEIDDILGGIRNINMKGWLVNGQNFCLDEAKSNINFFLLKDISLNTREQ